MRRLHAVFVAGLLAAITAGCANQPSLRDKVFHPGPALYQQQKAQRFDPYNEITVGSRDDTSRPLGYQQPNPEAAQGRWDDWGMPRFGHD